ncbi:MAG: T9SS type A sorting domain-containing protein [Cytophagales bacterium]|nr:T9SS type A sorting domain-containing protein [Cytophagales bacterium]
MKKLNVKFVVTLFCVICVPIVCLSQSFEWANSIGSTLEDQGHSIVVDNAGNVYVTGFFQDTADFDPGTDTANLTAIGFFDIFFAKYDAAGNLLWAKSIGSTSFDQGFSIAVDGTSNVYLTGTFTGTADFDPGAGTANLTSVGSLDIFFAKYNSAGNFLWAKNIGGGGIPDDQGWDITVDVMSNVYLIGIFSGIVDFDPDIIGIANLTSSGSRDIFVAKYNSAGNFLWANALGGTSFDEGFSIAVDGTGNVYVTGHFGGTADFDPGAGIANLTSVGINDIFFAKYNSAGNFLWAKSIGSTSFDEGLSIAVDGTHNVYLTGSITGTADFDPGAGTANLTPVGSADIFFAKYNSAGNFLWANVLGGTSYDEGFGIAVDGSGNVHLTGIFSDIVDFDPGAGTANLISVGSFDIFLAKYNTNGNYLSSKSIGSTSFDQGFDIAVDGINNVYLTGSFSNTADFDPDPISTTNLTSVGSGDIFLAKYSFLPIILLPKINFDIKPTSCPNPFNIKSNGILPVAILGTVDFDVNDIDVSSVLLGGISPIRSKIEDVSIPVINKQDVCDCTTDDADGFEDLTLKFKTQDIVSILGFVSGGDTIVLTITGILLDSTPFDASDCIIIIPVGGGGNDTVGGKVAICHIPPGNPANAHTIFVSSNAIDAHLAHGDNLGMCDSSGAFGGNNDSQLRLSVYPNPFSETTIIQIQLDETVNAALKVYNAIGTHITTLFNGTVEENNLYSIQFDAEDLPNGIYFYRLETENGIVRMGKLLLK